MDIVIYIFFNISIVRTSTNPYNLNLKKENLKDDLPRTLKKVSRNLSERHANPLERPLLIIIKKL